MQWAVKQNHDSTIVGDYHHITKKLLHQRGITSTAEADAFLHPNYERDVHDPYLFVQMPKVVDRITEAQKNKEIIGIFGDHDVDGVSGATVLADGLEELGFDVHVYIPDKHSEGHGINTTAIDEFAQKNVTLMISVDCGMTNIAEVDYAQTKTIDTIIIDHHHVPEVIPNAIAIINPQMEDSGYPFKGLCGTGAAFKVVHALYHALLPEKVSQLKWMLDIVGVGTVADCMPLLDENRTLVKYGLLVLSKTRRVGYQEMIRIGKLPITEHQLPTSTTIAFHIAPRINAAGRMAHARDAYLLLRSKDSEEAAERAQDIEQKNIERRKLTDKLVKEVDAIARRDFVDKPFIFVASEDYPVGIVGIIAGRIASTHGKPTGVFHIDGDESRGSFRSIENIHIVEILEESAAFLDKFGGHAAAAGATIQRKNIAPFVEAASAAVEKNLRGERLEKKMTADMYISAYDIDQQLTQELSFFEPFGQENEEPLFHIKDLLIVEAKTVGKTKKHLKLSLQTPDQKKTFDGIGFNLGDRVQELLPGQSVELMAHIQENEWMGRISTQFNIIDMRIMQS